MDSLVLQANEPKMPAVRNETDQEISWAMFKDGFNFLPFNFFGIFCICKTRHSWSKPIFDIFRHFEICKFSINTSKIAAVAHMFAVESL